MSEDNNVGNVHRGLREKRFAEKYRHTKNSRKPYDGEMWNSGDRQFLAFRKERVSLSRGVSHHRVHLDFFGFNYWNNHKENKITKVLSAGCVIQPKQTVELRDFLSQKPANETFIIPSFRGDYHLSFEKPSLFRETELRWRFLNHKEEWDKSLFLPRRERNSVRKDMKLAEDRQRLWFTAEQSDKLIDYLDVIISLDAPRR